MKFERVIRYVLETPWAIRPAVLGAIIDILVYRAEGGQLTDDELEARLGSAEAREAARRAPRSSGTVAIIPLWGSIFPRANIFTEMSGGTSLQMFKAAIAAAATDDKISAIVIDVASPGGMVDLVPETADLLGQIPKPTVAVADTEAASAAYWIASQADELVVTPSGEVGSIGVWMAHEDWSRHEGNLGIDTTLISAGKYKTETSPFAPLSEEAQAYLQSVVDTYYDMFVAAVAAGRGVSPSVVRNGFGEGRMVTAQRALSEGMVDRVATIDTVVSELAAGRTPVNFGRRSAEMGAPAPAAEATPSAEDLERELYEKILVHYQTP